MTHPSPGRLAVPCLVMLLSTVAIAADSGSGSGPNPRRNIEFARVDGNRLALDLYLPENVTGREVPVVVWVHGGAWRAGDRGRVPIRPLTELGFAIASVDYRLSPVARFPAQVHDIKAAVRFLRARSAAFGLDAERIAIAGASAGGHLAALTGVSGAELEGRVGEHLDRSSRVGAVVSFYGASNLQTILGQSTPHGLSVRVPALQMLLGAQPDEAPQLARLASPVAHLDRGDPPVLLLHGDQDPQMPINQSHELYGACRRLKLPARFEVVYGAAHGGADFYTPARLAQVADFLNTHLNRER